MLSRHTRKDDALDRLSDGIAQLTSSDAWRAWLRVQARFHRYSFNNTVLIQLQYPRATRIAGFGAWLKLGRHVRRGEQAIWILGPVTRRVAAEDDQEAARVVTAFRPVAVFALEQTEGEALPEPCTRLAGNDPLGVFTDLVRVAATLGFDVEEHVFADETNGDCAHALHRIRVRTDLAPAHRTKTLCHELAHALLHADVTDRALAELEAESIAFIVCDALGIDAGAWSFGDQSRRRAHPAHFRPDPVRPGRGRGRAVRAGGCR
jgi:N-terminal domain of anti-restriction factor ArdC